MSSGPAWKSYQDFVLKIERAGEGAYRVEAHGPTGEAETTFPWPFDEKDVEIFLLKVGRPRQAASRGRIPRPMQPAIEFGGRLYEAVLSGPVRDVFVRARHDAQQKDYGLRLRLRLADVPELSDLPWEFLYDGRDFLALSGDTPVVRYLDLPNPPRPISVALPLRILVTVSAPHDLPGLDVAQEKAKIQEALARLGAAGRVQIEYSPDATLRTLQRTLRRARASGAPFHIWHYIGHGGYDHASQSSVLMLCDREGKSYPIGGFQLGTLFNNHPETRLALLNACEGARADREDPFAGVAAALVERGIPAVIGMQFEITDRAAIVFSSEFYTSLVDGLPVDAALAEARRAIFFLPNWVEWATPVLYLRAPDGEIFDIDPAEAPRAEPTSPGPAVDEERDRQLRELYDRANSAYWVEDWGRAIRYFEAVEEIDPEHREVKEKLEEARRRLRWGQLYNQAQVAVEGEEWREALAALEALLAEAPDDQDAGRLYEAARQRLQLEGLYTEAGELSQAEQWAAVVRVFERIRELDPEHPDPEGPVGGRRARACRAGAPG